MEWRIKEGDAHCAQIHGSGRQIIKQPFFDELRKHPVKDEWWDLISPVRPDVAGKINVPTLIVAMFQDSGATAESIKIFTQQMAKVGNKKLVMINGDHGSAKLGPCGYSIVDEERMKFLNRWVKSAKNGIENEPPVTVYWEVQVPEGEAKKSVAGWVTHHLTWPDPAVERRPLDLTADAKMSPDHPRTVPDDGARLYLYPTGEASDYPHRRLDPMEMPKAMSCKQYGDESPETTADLGLMLSKRVLLVNPTGSETLRPARWSFVAPVGLAVSYLTRVRDRYLFQEMTRSRWSR
ncbi:CocE/NonD family hydrolase [Mesorhizobium sp.]|uniref:CocE/NonD family hydrolase n=1 Tax=Mesorhizobium sp. TaxID=1871066 RepID=UPI00257B91A7|nr:CocE/NonD family hydrolase [Mesorhizobium sp.]